MLFLIIVKVYVRFSMTILSWRNNNNYDRNIENHVIYDIKYLLDNSLMLVTALAPKIGYDQAAQIEWSVTVSKKFLRVAASYLVLESQWQLACWCPQSQIMCAQQWISSCIQCAPGGVQRDMWGCVARAGAPLWSETKNNPVPKLWYTDIRHNSFQK